MPDEFALPPPGLLRTEIINLGPVIEPKFSDARDWSEFLPPVETTPIPFEAIDPALSEEAIRRAVVEASAVAARELDGKRYELMHVRLASDDRTTHHPLVVYYDYSDDLVFEVLLIDGHDPAPTWSRYQPPLTAAEERLALELIDRDGQITDDLDTGAGIIVEDVNITSPRYGHRLVDLRFGPLDRRIPTAFAIVDLSTQDIVEIGWIPEGQP
jgi:hypothetical protein